MDKAVKQDWTAALRSGDYKQGGGNFKKENLYCCLGVLCEVHPELTLEPKESGAGWETKLGSKGYFRKPELIALRLSDTHQNLLVSMNDARDPFFEIADWIDEHVPTTQA